jgi:hypothetical protein
MARNCSRVEHIFHKLLNLNTKLILTTKIKLMFLENVGHIPKNAKKSNAVPIFANYYLNPRP